MLVPTADGPPPEPPPPNGRPPGWVLTGIVVLAAVTAVAVAVTRDDQPPTEEQVPAPVDPTLPMQQWDLVIFPGAGVFVDLAVGPSGAVAVTAAGTDWMAPNSPSHVWASDAEFDSWNWVDVEESPNAAITSVVIRGETIMAAGRLHTGNPTPALWSGTPDTGLSIIDEPFPAPGRLDLIRDLDGLLVVVGAPFDPSLGPTNSIVLRGSPGEWTDITPKGSTEINEVFSTRSEWIAAGTAESRRPAIWHSPDQGDNWSERPVMIDAPATVTDVTQVGDEIFAIARLNPTTSPASLLLRFLNDSWHPVGEPRTLSIEWISPVRGELIGGPGPASRGGPDAPYLWRHQGDGRWAMVLMQRSRGEDQFPTTFTAASDQIVAGTVIGQPALWMPANDTTPTIQTPVSSRQWERVAILPPDSIHATVLSDGRIVATVWPPGSIEEDGMQILISEDGVDWQSLPLPAGLLYGGVQPVGDWLVLVGATESVVVAGLMDESGFVELAEVDGRQLVAVDTEDDRVIVYVRVADSTSRVEIPIDPTGAIKTKALPWDPIFIHAFDDGLVVGGESETMVWPGQNLQVSTDAGVTWTKLDVEPWSVYPFGSDVIVSGEPRQTMYRLTLDPITLDPIDLPPEMLAVRDGWGLAGWAGGLAAFDPAGRILLLPELGAEVVTLELSPATGFDGIFVFGTGNGRDVMAMEQGERVLYRWTGQIP